MFDRSNLTEDGSDFLDISDEEKMKRRRKVARECVAAGIFTVEEALEAYSLTKEEFEQ